MATTGGEQEIPPGGTPHDQDMHSIAKVQKETWEAYEASDPGFAQVQNLIAELSHIVNNVGALTIGRGRSYTAGSFTLTQEKLGELTTGMLDYCRQNEKTATQGWQDMFSQYAADVEAANREQAGWDLLWDGLQIAAGALITVIGLGLTPFTGGFSLGLTVLGGALVIGGVNSAINHVSIATTGQQLNLAGMAGKAIGHWYDMNVATPAADSGSWGVQFLAGAGSGVIQAVSETAQLNVKEIGDSIYTLATDSAARDQAWKQLQTTAGKILNGDAYTIGEVASVLIPGAAGIKFTRASSLLSPTKFPNPNTFTKTLPANSPGWTTKLTGTGATTVRKDFTPFAKPIDMVDRAAAAAALSRIRGASVVGDIVLINDVEKMTTGQWHAIRTASVHNTSTPVVTLGKWEGPESERSYTNKAIKEGNEYFDLGNDWSAIRARHELSEEDMFILFNRPFLDDIIQEGKTIRFTHSPEGDRGALGSELKYLEDHGYVYDPATLTARRLN
jgi:hypothetical protein